MNQMLKDPFVLIVPVALFAGTILLGFVARRIIFAVLRGWARRTDSQLDVILIDSLGRPMTLWIMILGLPVATQNSEIPQRYMQYIPRPLQVLWVLSFTIALSRFAGDMVRVYGSAVRGVKSVTSISQKLVQLSIMLIGIVWMLKVVFDISLEP